MYVIRCGLSGIKDKCCGINGGRLQWRGLFGASDDQTGADYRACKNFGPLYATNR